MKDNVHRLRGPRVDEFRELLERKGPMRRKQLCRAMLDTGFGGLISQVEATRWMLKDQPELVALHDLVEVMATAWNELKELDKEPEGIRPEASDDRRRPVPIARPDEIWLLFDERGTPERKRALAIDVMNMALSQLREHTDATGERLELFEAMFVAWEVLEWHERNAHG